MRRAIAFSVLLALPGGGFAESAAEQTAKMKREAIAEEVRISTQGGGADGAIFGIMVGLVILAAVSGGSTPAPAP